MIEILSDSVFPYPKLLGHDYENARFVIEIVSRNLSLVPVQHTD